MYCYYVSITQPQRIRIRDEDFNERCHRLPISLNADKLGESQSTVEAGKKDSQTQAVVGMEQRS